MHTTLTAVQLLGVCLIMEPHTAFSAPPPERQQQKRRCPSVLVCLDRHMIVPTSDPCVRQPALALTAAG